MPNLQGWTTPPVQNGPDDGRPLSETDQSDGLPRSPRDAKGIGDRIPAISVIIPNRNGSATIGLCLDAALQAISDEDEVIVVDDGSTDGSVEIIRRYPCRLIRSDRHIGASRARNRGALSSRGDILFFTDADCLIQEDALCRVRSELAGAGPGVVLGGTYTPAPHDRDFFSRFQSVLINHCETRQPGSPDYVASHAMAMHRSTFLRSGGFPEDFLPIIEDVELSHRLRTNGCRLFIDPAVQVRHIFRFSLGRSLRNALRKSRYWTRYSIGNRDLLADSGTASRGLKVNVASWTALAATVVGAGTFALPVLCAVAAVTTAANLTLNRGLFHAWWRTGGPAFGIGAAAYYILVYPAAVLSGAARGLADHLAAPFRSGTDKKREGCPTP